MVDAVESGRKIKEFMHLETYKGPIIIGLLTCYCN